MKKDHKQVSVRVDLADKEAVGGEVAAAIEITAAVNEADQADEHIKNMEKYLSYDGKNMLLASELKSLRSRLSAAKQAVEEDASSGRQGWMALPDDTEMIRRVKSAAKQAAKFENCLVLGIGGSDLGARAIYKALGKSKAGMKLNFAGGNTDPDELYNALAQLDLKKTLVNIISKSGDTIEPMSAFEIVKQLFKKKVGKNYNQHILATTDQSSGSLRAMVDSEKFGSLPIPKNVGGRFSVLTDVGLFPLACAGISITDILNGAASERSHEEAEVFAGLQYLAYQKNQKIQILMPYSESLREFGFWFRQLWAESLGKKFNREGRVINTGPTPVAALGATDQHSQIQLYNEGPNDKTITFIEVDKFHHDMVRPDGLALSKIIHAEREATAKALKDNQRPNGTIHIPEVSATTIGALVMFFEIATAISGELYDVNAYDQPGVEAGKKNLKKLL